MEDFERVDLVALFYLDKSAGFHSMIRRVEVNLNASERVIR